MRSPLSRWLAGATVAAVAAGLGGCDLTMFTQPKYKTEAPASLFADAAEAQRPPDGTVAQGETLADQQSAVPPPPTPALLARGRERYQIYCTPCHGADGAGNGLVVARGFPHPPDYTSAQVRRLTGAQMFGVITRGYGVMFPYADRIEPRDRWAIVAYVRALQLARTPGALQAIAAAGSYGGRL